MKYIKSIIVVEYYLSSLVNNDKSSLDKEELSYFDAFFLKNNFNENTIFSPVYNLCALHKCDISGYLSECVVVNILEVQDAFK